MKPPKQIVFLKNSKSKDFVYTANIKSIRLDGNSYIVIFDNGQDYRYGRDKVLIYEFSSYRNEVNIYVDGQLQNQYSAAYDYHKYYLFAGQSIISDPIGKGKNIEIHDIKTNLDRVRSAFAYFKEISAFPNIFNQEEDSEDNRTVNQTSADIIVKALDRIKIRDNVSVLSNYLEGVTPITYNYNKAIIYPFGCNESQKCAVENALKNSVSVVEGPPGTGKTQTILNIIANVVSDNQSVAVVSNNNSAVYNIQEKLNKYGYGSLVATLGSNENKTAFFENQSTIERFKESKLSKQQIYDIDKQISTISARLTESLQKRNKVAKLKSMLKEVECQAQHFITAHNSENFKQIEKKFHRCNSLQKSFKLRKLLLNGNLSLSTKLTLFFKYGFYDIFRVEDYSDVFITFANYKFYEQYISSIRSEIIELEQWLEEQNEQLQLKELIELSKQLFTAKLFDKYSPLDDIALTKDNYKNRFSYFLKRYPVVTSSTLSLLSSLPNDYIFDYLIIDESSQVDIIKASICFACARRVVIVGDSCQLSHIVDSESAKLSNQLLVKYNIPEAYNYVKYSVLDSIKALYGDRLSVTLLKEHYRCHPDIIAFCNKRYYNDELVVMTNRAQGELSPFKIIETNITTFSNHSNQRQIDETEKYITTKFKDDYSVVGVVSPYRAHANILQSQLPQGCEADTIHKYQGREKDVIIFNTVAGEINKFIDNPNLINVAVSRAVKEFIIVKSKTMDLPHGSNIGDLIRYIYYNFDSEEVKQSGVVCSVFDLLYKEYNRLYSTFYSKNSDIAGSPAEIIMHNLLEELLTESQFRSIDFIREYYLRDLINDLKDFSDDEIEFIRNGSRLDFLLYNKIDRSPILAIEVDGVSFHNNAIQKERDTKKNHILSILNIPLLRLSTDGKDEKQRIVESLQSAMRR